MRPTRRVARHAVTVWYYDTVERKLAVAAGKVRICAHSRACVRIRARGARPKSRPHIMPEVALGVLSAARDRQELQCECHTRSCPQTSCFAPSGQAADGAGAAAAHADVEAQVRFPCACKRTQLYARRTPHARADARKLNVFHRKESVSLFHAAAPTILVS